MMTKLRETESARIRHRRRDHRNAIINESEFNSTTMHIQKWCVIETEIKPPRTEPHAQPLLTVGY